MVGFFVYTYWSKKLFGDFIFYSYICIVKLLELKFMEYKVGDKTQIYCVTQEWVDGNDSEVLVMACFLNKKDAIAFMDDTWEDILNDDGNKYNMTECSETMKEAWKSNKRAKHHLSLFIDTVTLR